MIAIFIFLIVGNLLLNIFKKYFADNFKAQWWTKAAKNMKKLLVYGIIKTKAFPSIN